LCHACAKAKYPFTFLRFRRNCALLASVNASGTPVKKIEQLLSTQAIAHKPFSLQKECWKDCENGMNTRPDATSNQRLDDAARAGWLYYVAGNTQDQIAAKLGISRQSAQRLVSLAVSEG